jgi:RNA 3'-terminal phosphate cyclase (ATP)
VLELDASHGEGGGQVLRCALSLAVVLGRAVALDRVRATRPRPGLQPQHLTVVRALATISDAHVEGDALDSTRLVFAPRGLRAGDHAFDVGAIRGSAGSVSLLFQALLLPLALAPAPSRLVLGGGTHVPRSPPVHYLDRVFLPAVRSLGIEAEVTLRRWGWFPRGGGEIEASIRPATGLTGLRWEARVSAPEIAGVSAVSRLPLDIAERQRRQALARLRARGIDPQIALVDDREARGPGTLIFLAATGAGTHAGSTALGRRGVRAETVADEAVDGLLRFLDSGAAVDDHLADQLVPFLALSRGPSTYSCPTPSSHLATVAWLVEQFGAARIAVRDGPPARVVVTPSPRVPGRP